MIENNKQKIQDALASLKLGSSNQPYFIYTESINYYKNKKYLEDEKNRFKLYTTSDQC